MGTSQAFRNALHVPLTDPVVDNVVRVVTPGGDQYPTTWGGAGGVAEAPVDGEQYVRQDAAWAPVALEPTDLMTAIKTVDGAGSGLDADYLDGHSGEYFDEVAISPTDPGPSYELWYDPDDPGVPGGLEEAPVDGLQYARRDAAWAEVVQQNYGNLFNYMFNAAGIVPPPATGAIRFNHATQNLATIIWLHYTTNDSISVNLKTYFAQRIKVGDTLYIQDKDQINKWQLFEIVAPFTDSGTYATIPVAWRAGGSQLTQARVVLSREGASVASPIGEAPDDGEIYARGDETWKQIPTITVAATPPAAPATGDVWINTT